MIMQDKKNNKNKTNVGPLYRKKREEMLKKSNGARTVPQIFIGEDHVGGNDELQALEKEGNLDNLLKN